MTKNTEEKPNTYLLAAFAIEDRVDFRFVEQDAKSDSSIWSEKWNTEGNSQSHIYFSRDISDPEEKANQSEYFEQVEERMELALKELIRIRGLSVFNSIDMIAISTAGVVEKNRTLIQLPLWNWETGDRVQWKGKKYFDFADVICNIAKKLGAEFGNEEAFMKKIFVVNDVTACAAVEYNARRGRDVHSAHHFVFVKVHNGINVGMIEKGEIFARDVQPEMGHIYPNYHEKDVEIGYLGSCFFHSNCIEGMISLQSLYDRASLIPEWSEFLDDPQIRKKKTTLFKRLIPETAKKDSVGNWPLGIDMAAHYIAQLIHPLILSPALPSNIVIGGRFAREAVLDAVREKIFEMVGMERSYPAREEFSDIDALRKFVLPASVGTAVNSTASAKSEAKKSIEVIGALQIARSNVRKRDVVTPVRKPLPAQDNGGIRL